VSDFATGAGTFSFLNKLKWQQLGRLRRAAIDSSDGTYLQQNPLLQPPDLRHQFDSVFALEKMLGARGRYVWETWTYPATDHLKADISHASRHPFRSLFHRLQGRFPRSGAAHW
jgi:hypothetical protein